MATEQNLSEKELPRQETYGRSFSGRPLKAFLWGEGSTPLLFLGSLEGQKASADFLMYFAKELCKGLSHGKFLCKTNPAFIFSTKKLFFLPNPNPEASLLRENDLDDTHPLYRRLEGLLRNIPPEKRGFNLRGVAVEKNFNYRFGESAQKIPDFSENPGTFPESEPETKALGHLLRSLSPRAVLHFKVGGSCLLPPVPRNSALEHLLLRQTPFLPLADTPAGSLEGWLAEELSCAVVRIPLSSEEGPEKSFQKLLPFLASVLTL